MEEQILAVALVSLMTGVCFLGRYLYLYYKSRNERSFTVIALGFLLFWLFGGTSLMVAGAVLLAILTFRWLF